MAAAATTSSSRPPAPAPPEQFELDFNLDFEPSEEAYFDESSSEIRMPVRLVTRQKVPEKEWMTVRWAAEKLGKSERYVRELLAEGTLTGRQVKSGGHWDVLRASVMEILGEE
jgi:excisionase family DNA binding protein